MSELTATDVAIEQIKKAGFSHIKVELEADLGRDGERECSYCDDGYDNCGACDGDGVVMAERPNGTSVEVECDDCYGEGRVECSECDGEGYGGGYHDEEWCEEFMRENVPKEVLERLTYGNFYEDGSVDSEFTFTVPIDHYKDVVEWINSFVKLSDEIGNGYETYGAGMHISVIPQESGGNYPVRGYTFPEDKINNFKREMSKLIPAMIFFSSVDKVSRELNYRQPAVSSDDKYNAIFTHHDTCIEYRAFETCYKNPELIYEHFQVIANSLEFYVDPTKRANVETFSLDGDRYSSSREIKRFYQSPEKIKALRKQIMYLKPKSKTPSECFAQREMFTVTELRKQLSKRSGELRKEYYKARETQKVALKTPMTERQQNYYEELKRSNGRYGDTMTEQQMINAAKGVHELPTVEEYIKQHLKV